MPTPTPPPHKPPFRILRHALGTTVLSLPRPPTDAPDAAWQDAVQDSLDKVAALDPRDAIEAMLAVDLVVLNAAQRDALRLAAEPAATAKQARLQRAGAVARFRSFAATVRLLDRQRRLPAVPERGWAGAVSELSAIWRTASARPLAALRSAAGRPALARLRAIRGASTRPPRPPQPPAPTTPGPRLPPHPRQR